MINCGYCFGERSPCTCDEDCGARATDYDHVCMKAPWKEIESWLRSTSFYSDAELAWMAEERKQS